MSARAAVELGEMRQRRYDAIRSGDLTDAGFQIIR
jgi:hypothetical protein